MKRLGEHAIVIGASMGGLLAARALSDFYTTVTVLERDALLSGSWSEATRNVSGQVSGRAAGGRIQATVDAGAFTADLTVHTSENQQSVSIAPRGTDIKVLAVTMHKG